MSSGISDSSLNREAELARLQAEVAKAQAEAAAAKARAAEAEMARLAALKKREQSTKQPTKAPADEAPTLEAEAPPIKTSPTTPVSEPPKTQPAPASAGNGAQQQPAAPAKQATPPKQAPTKQATSQQAPAKQASAGSAEKAKAAQAPAGKDKQADSGNRARNEAAVRRTAPAKQATPTAPARDPRAKTQPALPGSPVVEEEVEFKGYRSLFQFLGSMTFSIIVHMVILIALALMFLPVIIREAPQLMALQERPQEMLTQVLDQQITPSTNVTISQSNTALPEGHATALESKSEPTFKEAPSETGPAVNVGPIADLSGVQGSTFNTNLPEGAPGDPQAVVDSMDEAMDRITHEILMMLEQSKVLVVWVFDESESMEDDRKEIRTKIDRVYTELGLKGATNNDALMNAVTSYGQEVHIHSNDPTYVVDDIKRDMDAVKLDESGVENMCFAVGKTINYYKKFARAGRRQMAIILVTDESGDVTTNQNLLEATIAEAKDARCRIYTLGREAVFGYPYAYMRWKDVKTNINYWLRIDRGPETPRVEQLQTNGFWRRWDAHPSGFGPYEQARMARETGGIFFMLPSPETNLVRRDDRKYALAKLRPYLPSLETRQEYDGELHGSKLRSVLWKVINDLNPWNPEQARYIVMRDDFSIDPNEFRRQATIEMQKAMRYVIYLDQAEKALEAIANERDKEIYPRWQANYDLMYAQILAYKVRIYQYGAYLAWFLEHPQKPNPKPPNPRLTLTNWDIRTRKEILPSDKWPEEEQQKYIDKATALLKKIIKEHDGTPWAARAQWELARGFGVHLVQEWDDPRRGNVKLPKY